MTTAATVNDSHGSGAETRRDFLYTLTGAMVAVGTGAALWPLIGSMNPAADVVALSTIEVDLGPIELGQRITVKWRGQPLFIDHRAPEQIARARADDRAGLRDPEPDSARVTRPEWLVMIGICTHLGCVPLGQKAADPKGGWGGWFCPCHGSHYDTSGRIRKGPAPRNLVVPPYAFLDRARIRIG
ncbi:MAG: ubiquinol-cytochrome c reductase iron-sulfur subunit [Rhodospirillales bacterium]|nr:ubiquinol-cytochrome c reductase iron-sulfur subunit [Rhodospirillales bacterium]